MQKKIFLFSSFVVFVFLTGFYLDLHAQVRCVDAQECEVEDDDCFFEELDLDRLKEIEQEFNAQKPKGILHNEKVQIALTYLRMQTNDTKEKVTDYFMHHRTAYALTVSSVVLLVMLGVALKIFSDDVDGREHG